MDRAKVYAGLLIVVYTGRNMEHKFNLAGWIFFLVCAGFFIASAIQAGDICYIVGSVIFLFGCILFLIPLLMKNNKTNH